MSTTKPTKVSCITNKTIRTANSLYRSCVYIKTKLNQKKKELFSGIDVIMFKNKNRDFL